MNGRKSPDYTVHWQPDKLLVFVDKLDPHVKPPEKPLPTDCCGSGCERCVYDIYFEHLKKYRAWKASRKQPDEQD